MLYVLLFLLILDVAVIVLFYKKQAELGICSSKLNDKILIEQNNKVLAEEVNNLKIIEGEKKTLEKQLELRENSIQELLQKINVLREQSHETEKKFELINQEKEQLINEKNEWQNEKSKLLKEIAYNIIQENIKNNNELQEKGEKKIKEITEGLINNFSSVLEKVKSLNDDSQKTESQLELIKRGLLSPSGAGMTSETTLYNILKSSNLQEKDSKDGEGDYIIQTSFNTQNQTEDTKRPDCIVYLPNNNYLIVDSKSSKHFLELQKAIDEKNDNEIKEIKKKIKDRMDKHLLDLESKDYQNAQREYLGLNNSNNATIMTVMFLQTEKMMEIIRDIDPNFENKCNNKHIYPLSPIGLVNLLNSAKYVIQKEKQNASYEKLMEELRKLFNNIGNLFENANKLGKSLEKSLTEYNNFANVFNKNILLRLKNISKMGIESNKIDFVNKKLDSYSFSINTVDSEAEEINKNNLIEDKKYDK